MGSILFDIGRTKMRIAYSANEETFEEPRVFETPENYKESLRLFAETAKELAKGSGLTGSPSREIKKIAGGVSRSIPGWDSEKLKNDLEKEFGVRVFLENDAALAGLGEANFGAGRGFGIVAYITVSTGVGGARIVDGKIDERAIGFEPGKQIIDVDTGKTLEKMISGRALQERFGKHPKEISDQNIWDEYAKILAIGLNNIIVEWSPDCVVLGGSMITGSPAIPLDRTKNHLKEILKIFPEIPPIRRGELGDFGGLCGALIFIKAQLQSGVGNALIG